MECMREPLSFDRMLATLPLDATCPEALKRLDEALEAWNRRVYFKRLIESFVEERKRLDMPGP